ncbi:MAG: hypothetical protein NWE89_04505 [Candidatus Bathyarchaeota archaeon]|nr:hypothetical protein [Candidatus Bathyarchaeota archaeon]
MTGQRNCVFVEGKACSFQSENIPLETCKICIKAWKTDLKLRNKRVTTDQQVVQSIRVASQGIENELADTKQKLRELDDLFKDDNIEPEDYIRLRREHTSKLLGNGVSAITPVQSNEVSEKGETHVVVVVKSLIGNRVHTYPEGWELPKAINDRVLNKIFNLAKDTPVKNIKVGVGDYKIAGIKHVKGKIALLIISQDEEFETYNSEIERISEAIAGDKHWVKNLKKLMEK